MEVVNKVSYWYDKKRGEYRFKRTRHQIVYFKTEAELMEAIALHERETAKTRQGGVRK